MNIYYTLDNRRRKNDFSVVINEKMNMFLFLELTE